MSLKLPFGRTEREAIAVAKKWRERIWNEPARDEDERIDRLTEITTRMCEGDKASGDELARRAIWA